MIILIVPSCDTHSHHFIEITSYVYATPHHHPSPSTSLTHRPQGARQLRQRSRQETSGTETIRTSAVGPTDLLFLNSFAGCIRAEPKT